jgi:V/A-type H+-transporting ATPase subunit I
MKLLTAVVLEQKSDEVIKVLLQLGVMDFVSIKKISPRQMERLGSRPVAVSKAALQDMRHRVEAVLRQGHCLLPSSDMLDVNNLEKPDIEGYRAQLDDLGKNLAVLKDSQKGVNQQLLGLQELKRYIAEGKTEYLDIRVGTIGRGTAEDLSSKLAAEGGLLQKAKEGDSYISLSLHRDSAKVSPLLDKFGWTESSNTRLQKIALVEMSSRIDSEHRLVAERLQKIEADVDRVVAGKREELDRMWCNLRLNELCNQIRSYFSYTRNTTLFSGWVPADLADSVSEAIRTASDGQCVVEWTEAEEMPREEIPVAISTPKALSPFKKMVDNYNTPEYGSVNPTFFVMVAYLTMFALMFADVGQGFVLLLVGILGGLDYKHHPLKPDGMISRNLCKLLLYLGCASMAGGVLFGSYFGYSLFPAIWFNYDHVVNGEVSGSGMINDVYSILGLTVKFGIIIIYLGLAINWVNLSRKKDWVHLFLDKNGIAGGWVFAVGLYLGYGYVENQYRSFPSAPWIAPALAVPIVLMILPGFIVYRQSVRKGGPTRSLVSLIMENLLEWLINLLEIFIGYLSNTLSFMRVAGLGIAHVSLMTAFKDLGGQAGGFWGVLIFLFGNLLVIVLEGLSSGIQALRLNYYEFFSKYFNGKGVAYEPVGLRSPFSANK